MQLTTAGAVFGFVLSNRATMPVLFILPVTSYLFAASFFELHGVMRQAATYIDTVLHDQVAGGLGWERWVGKANESVRQLEFLHPFLIAFPGVSVLSLVVTAPYALQPPKSASGYGFAIWIAWVGGLLLTLLSARVAWKLFQPARRPPDPN
ncbi:hypothetical protein [Blastococcus sp. SYSU D00695]